MSSCVISDADAASCKPWEMASFEVDPHPVRNADYAGVSLPTIEQIDAIQEQARQEGFQAGQAEGYAQGMQEAARETERLRSLVEAFTGELGRADEAVSQQLLDLALDFTRALLKTTLAVHPDLILPIVREAVRYVPSVQQPAMLYLHPGDVTLVQARMGDELAKLGWHLADDPAVEPGGCRVETPSNQIDATLPTRWQRLAAALGKDTAWLAA